jgi:Tfp pilus assembly protein PilF
MRCYQESVQIHPTAEAHTFLGWTYSFLQRYEDAIEECRNAIAIDPAFGNPCNDIGRYLIRMGKLDAAVPWLERALTATHYDTRHYPHLNLGRIALAKGDLLKAACEFRRALEVQPRSLTARRTLAALSTQLN